MHAHPDWRSVAQDATNLVWSAAFDSMTQGHDKAPFGAGVVFSSMKSCSCLYKYASHVRQWIAAHARKNGSHCAIPADSRFAHLNAAMGRRLGETLPGTTTVESSLPPGPQDKLGRQPRADQCGNDGPSLRQERILKNRAHRHDGDR